MCCPEFPGEFGTKRNQLMERGLCQIIRGSCWAECAETCSLLWFSLKKKKIPLHRENARFSGWNFLSELLSPSMAERTIRRELQDGRADTSLADPVCHPESLQTSPVRAWAPCRTLWHVPRVSRKFLFFLGVGNGFQERPPSWPQDPISDDLVGQDIFPLSPDCSLKRVKPRDGKRRCLPCWGVTAKAASAASGSLWSGGP